MKYFLFFFILFFKSINFNLIFADELNFFNILKNIRNDNSKFFQFIRYSTLQKINDIIYHESKKYKIPVPIYLIGRNAKYRKKLVNSILGGLKNRDPRIRLYCAHLLLKLSPYKSWIELHLEKILDSKNKYRETSNNNYRFKDIYGIIRNDNLKKSLLRLIWAEKRIILVQPDINFKSYKNYNYNFEWSSLPGAKIYELYIDDILYYKGQSTFISTKRIFDKGIHEWLVLAKDKWNKQISYSQGKFIVKKLKTPKLTIIKNKDHLFFNWTKVLGAEYYNILMKKIFLSKYKIVYKSKKNKVSLYFPIPKGNYFLKIMAFNYFQKTYSKKKFLKSFGNEKPYVFFDKKKLIKIKFLINKIIKWIKKFF